MGFEGRFEGARERLVVLDDHSDTYLILDDHPNASHTMESNFSNQVKEGEIRPGKRFSLYPPSLSSNYYTTVYPVFEDRKTKAWGAQFEILEMPFILHYGSEWRLSYNYRAINTKELLSWAVKRIKKSVSLHIDPDILSETAEIAIAERYAKHFQLNLEKKLKEFRKDPRNPFYSSFGHANITDALKVFELDIEKLYIAEAFHYADRLNTYHIEVGKAVIGWFSSTFLGKLPSKAKAFLIDTGSDDQDCFFKSVGDAIAHLKDIKEVVKFDGTATVGLSARLSMREEILKEAYPLLITSTHAGAAYIMEDIVIRVKI